MCTPVCMCMYSWRPEKDVRVSLIPLSRVFPLNPKLVWQSRSPRTPPICACPQCWDYRLMWLVCDWIFMVLRFELWSLCLHSKFSFMNHLPSLYNITSVSDSFKLCYLFCTQGNWPLGNKLSEGGAMVLDLERSCVH